MVKQLIQKLRTWRLNTLVKERETVVLALAVAMLKNDTDKELVFRAALNEYDKSIQQLKLSL